MLVYRYAAMTDSGNVRSNNEDNFYIDGIWKTDVETKKYAKTGISLTARLTAAVCDGMGGEAYGEDASLIAVETISKYDRTEWTEETAQACIHEANEQICRKSRQEGETSGSTLCLLLLNNNMGTAYNLGDSRIYCYCKHELRQLSTDHSVVGRMIRQGQITEEEARTHPRRHQITQYLGIDPEEMELAPSVSGPFEIAEGNRYLICSDGLSDMLTDQIISNILEEVPDTEDAASKLTNEALSAGGRDNVTVLLIDVIDNGEEITADYSNTDLYPAEKANQSLFNEPDTSPKKNRIISFVKSVFKIG